MNGPGRTSRRCQAGVSSVLLLLLLSPALLAADVAPVRVDENLCYKPHDLAGVWGHLLFGYTVSPEGRVGNVRLAYDRVEPEEHRSALIKALTGCINAWSFRPGTKDGRRARFYQLVPFHFFRPAPDDDLDVPIPGGRTIGLSRIQEMYKEKLVLADKLLASRTYTKAEGNGWVLRTNVRQKFANDIKKALEFASAMFDTVFLSAPTIPDEVTLEIVLFRDYYDYSLVVAFDNLLPGRYAGDGRYSMEDHTIYASVGAKPPSVLTDMMVHEMTHHLIYMRLYGGDRYPPQWTSEGIASFIETIKRSSRKGLDLSRVQRGKASGGGFIYKRSAEAYLDALNAELKRGSTPGLPEILEGEFDENFYQGGWDIYYGTSWVLVHYLVNADGGKYRPGFERWLLSEDGSVGDAESLATAIGKPLNEIEAALPAYVKAIK